MLKPEWPISLITSCQSQIHFRVTISWMNGTKPSVIFELVTNRYKPFIGSIWLQPWQKTMRIKSNVLTYIFLIYIPQFSSRYSKEKKWPFWYDVSGLNISSKCTQKVYSEEIHRNPQTKIFNIFWFYIEFVYICTADVNKPCICCMYIYFSSVFLTCFQMFHGQLLIQKLSSGFQRSCCAMWLVHKV